MKQHYRQRANYNDFQGVELFEKCFQKYFAERSVEGYATQIVSYCSSTLSHQYPKEKHIIIYN